MKIRAFILLCLCLILAGCSGDVTKSDGYAIGYDNGYSEGYRQGYEDAIREQYEEIYSEGFDDGYNFALEE